jgi:HSP20 family protein
VIILIPKGKQFKKEKNTMAKMLNLIPRANVMFPMRDVFDRFFEDISMTSLLNDEKSFVPVFDISENEKEYSVIAELPGIEEKDMEVTLLDGILTVKGEKKQETEDKEETCHRIERRYGSFLRSFRIPDKVKTDKIDAIFKNGVLRLTLPKSEESEVTKIKIKH